MKIAFCLRVNTTPAQYAAVGFSRHLRDLGAGLRGKRASQKPFDGDNRLTGIRTRGSQ
jgi:hypothetical protein